jgi:ribose transport system substrate-binding protein
LQAANVSLTVCGDTVQTLNPQLEKTNHYRIGFANLSEKIPFAIDVRRGLERAAKNLSNIDLVVADNDLNGETALQVAEQFIKQGVDLMIEYQIDEAVGNILMNRFRENKIPVIAVDLPMVGATYYGADNYQSGLIAGQALGTWIIEHWQGKIDKLIILEEKRVGPLPAARMQGQLHGLEQKIGKLSDKQKTVLDSGNTSKHSHKQVLSAVETWPKETRIAVISFNDDAALGALKALKELDRESQAAIVGQGADRLLRQEIREGNPAIVGSTAFRPEAYGEMLLNLALQVLKGEPVPPAVYSHHTFINQDTINDYYED